MHGRVQAHTFWESDTAVEIVAPSTPDVIVPTEDELNSAVQVGSEDVSIPCRLSMPSGSFGTEEGGETYHVLEG